jgi:asparagine synthase (glutamine-hydrolysing)
VLPRSPDGRLPSLDGAITSLRHRGPDAEGTFRDSHGGLECGLAHARLAIIDLSPSGRQPMATPDGRLTIVFNGEIYNYREVRRELAAAGDVFETQSDTEVILRSYARWGKDCLRRFRGMFAFAIWDTRDGSLFLARDPMGVKPLYVARVAGGVLFASEVRALLDSGWVDRRLNAEALPGYLAFGSVREPETLVRGVEMLGPGSFARLGPGGWEQGTYWQPPIEVDASISQRDAVEQIAQILRESVALRLVADVPVGIFLSGGMDSSSVVSLASKASSSPVHTFTVTFDEARFDEGAYAKEVADRFGAEHHVVHLSSKRALAEIDDALGALDQPSGDGTNTYFVSQAVRRAGLAVALSGIGADELFAGYAYFRQFRTIMRFRRALAQGPLPVPAALGSNDLSMRARKVLRLLGTKGEPFEVYALLRAVFVDSERRSLLGSSAGRGDGPRPFDAAVSDWMVGPRGDALAAFGLLDATNYLRNTLLRDTDVMGMASALEVREPLLDHRLVERMLTLPGAMKLARGRNKPLLAAAVPDLPTATVTRKKMGFTLPLADWLRGPLRSWAEDKLAATAAIGIDTRAAMRTWDSFQGGRVSFSQVWTLIALSEWCRRQRMAV